MATVRAAGTQVFVQYDGANSMELLSMMETGWGSAVITSEIGGVLVITYGPSLDQATLATGDWFCAAGGNVISNSDFQSQYIIQQ